MWSRYFDMTDDASRWYSLMMNGTQRCILWEFPGSPNYMFYKFETKIKLGDNIRLDKFIMPQFHIFCCHGYLQCDGSGYDGCSFLRYHLYQIQGTILRNKLRIFYWCFVFTDEVVVGDAILWVIIVIKTVKVRLAGPLSAPLVVSLQICLVATILATILVTFPLPTKSGWLRFIWIIINRVLDSIQFSQIKFYPFLISAK